jgi:mannose-6-phosphate isomerase-like protein (cupin superfamily)
MTVLSAEVAELLARLPAPPSKDWPQGEPFTVALAHGTMSVEVYAPRGNDPQTPHEQDELYIVFQGRAVLELEGERREAPAGTVLFVPARARHRFYELTADFAAWVVFWGPQGGER